MNKVINRSYYLQVSDIITVWEEFKSFFPNHTESELYHNYRNEWAVFMEEDNCINLESEAFKDWDSDMADWNSEEN